MKNAENPIICCGFTPCVQRILEFRTFLRGTVNRAEKVTIGIGGKGANTARLIRQLGGAPILLEFAGGAHGRRLEQMLDSEGIDFRHVETEGETRICQTLLEAGNPEPTELVEEMPPVSPGEWVQMTDLLGTLPLEGSMVTISGKLPAGAPVGGYAEICALIRSRGGRVILDAQGEPLMAALEHAPAIVKINDAELREASGLDDLMAGTASLMDRGASSVLITRGSRSAVYVDAAHRLEVFPPTIDAVNPIGSGDAVTAGLAIALNEGRDIPEALVLGTACGAANALNLLSGYLKPQDVSGLKEQVVLRAIES
jgi:tagatose 6-phosphate kinase